jgi:hypothetical protein
VEKCYQRIEKAGLKINPDKSFFGKKEIEYLGYWSFNMAFSLRLRK